MKKLLCLIAIICSITSYAQFKLTPEGLVTEDGKDFYVVSIDGTQEDLYNRAKMAITTLFKSAKDVVTEVPSSQIKISAISVDDVFIKQLGHKTTFRMPYTLNILFKDGRIRFDAPSIEELYTYTGNQNKFNLYLGMGGGASIGDCGHIFKKDGKVRYKDGVASIESYFNTLIAEIVKNIQTPAAEEEW